MKWSSSTHRIIASAMRRSGLLEVFPNAVGRGAEVDVFADHSLNQQKYDSGATQLKAAKPALHPLLSGTAPFAIRTCPPGLGTDPGFGN
ncbi:MAG: hypothetical protein P8X51_19785 [Maritimibacter sp.]